MATVSEIMPRLVEEFPQFRPRWQEHLVWWKGKAAGDYNDIAEFVHFVLEELHPSGDVAALSRVFGLMEQWLSERGDDVKELIVIGFFETLQNVASSQRDVFTQFLGDESRKAWKQLELDWDGKE